MATGEPNLLSAQAKAAIVAVPAYLSVVSYWEVMIKSMKGLLDVGDPRLWFDETLEALSLQPLLHRPEHVAALFPLPPLHQDPFDLTLIAQAVSKHFPRAPHSKPLASNQPPLLNQPQQPQ